MTSGYPIKIISSGKYLPRVVSSEEIEKKLGIPSGFSIKYSGVNNRHHVTDESNGHMGAKAIEEALEKSSLKLQDIDLLISAGATYDFSIPNQASVIKSELKDGNATSFPAIDIDTTCLSFVTALDILSRMLDGKQYKNAIIVSSEIASKGLNPNNAETSTLFGDAAVAFIIQHDTSGNSHLIKSVQKTYTEGVNNAMIKGGGLKYHFKDHSYDPEFYSFDMKGKKLLKMAKKKLPEFIDDFFNSISLTVESSDVIIPHQASKMGGILFERMYKFKEGQIKSNLENNGNCIAASIPLLLHDSIENNEIKRGDICFLIGTSAGFSIGAILLKY